MSAIVPRAPFEALFTPRVIPTFHELHARFDRVHPLFRDVDYPPYIFDRYLYKPSPETTKFAAVVLPRICDCTGSELDADWEDLGLRPATFLQGMAFAQAFPDEQLKGSIALPGSVAMYQLKRHVIVLGVDVGKRVLELYPAHEFSKLPFIRYLGAAEPSKPFDPDEIIC